MTYKISSYRSDDINDRGFSVGVILVLQASLVAN